MRLNSDITGLLSSKAKIAVLKYFFNPGFSATGRELARLCGISHTQVIKILKEFESMNLATYTRAGASVVWRANTGSFAYLKLSGIMEKKENYVPLEHLKNTLKNELKKPGIERAVIFGSVAANKDTISSDIDLFVLVKDMKTAKATGENLADISLQCMELYGNPLSPHIVTVSEYQQKKGLALFKNIEGGIKVI
jgi:predicted nucleotidyltransferase